MTTYAIGDVQGCLIQLKKLLKHINFYADKDTLWFTGDLVNRGPHSLETLRFIKSLGEKHVVILGNHDLHLLAVAYGEGRLSQSDTLSDILTAPDKIELLEWLRHKSLLHYDPQLNFVMTHAGLAPVWTLATAQQLSLEFSQVLCGEQAALFLKNMYGNKPNQWRDDLNGLDRWRCIVNFFTRMRFCQQDGSLDLDYKGGLSDKPDYLIPWFKVANRFNAKDKIIFGHWAALGGKVDMANLYPLDTGCVWGNCLTALCLETEKRFSITC